MASENATHGSNRRRFLKSTAGLTTVGTAGLAGMGSATLQGTTTINAFLWEGYGGTVKMFNEQSDDVQVKFDRATSTSKMFQKTRAAPDKYDVVLPNSGYVRRFRDAGLAKQLASSKQELKEKVPNIDNTFKYFRTGTLKDHLTNDQGQWYGVPIRFGAYGITINKNELDASIIDNGKNINGLWTHPNKLKKNIGVRAHPVHAIPYALRALGYTDKMRRGDYIEVTGKAWEKTREKFLELAPLTRALFDSESQANRALASGAYNLAVGQGRNDTISLILKSNRPFEFITPEGALSWTEGGMVTKSSKKTEASLKFLNFLLTPKAGAQLTVDDKAPSVVAGAKKHLTQEQIDTIYLPTDKVESMVQDKPFKNPQKWKQLMNEFKSRL